MWIADNREELRRGFILSPLLVLAITILLLSCNKHESTSAAAKQETFASPEAAGQALFDAAKSGDQTALMAIFGPDGKDLIFSGDAVKDKNTAQRFVSAYQEMNRWSKSESGEQILYIGADNFAFPIPLKQDSSSRWIFDTAAGKNEVLARRIGDGELTAIGVLTEVANAQREYFRQNHQFAQKFVSDEGQHNGLYWPAAEGGRASPLGPLADVVKALGYSHSDKPQPFNGYYFRILTRQNDTANGGAKDYVQDGKMTGGFAVLAWPARYRNSGIMAFMVGKDGIVREKDLGDKTPDASTVVTAYDPSWKAVPAPEAANVSSRPPNAAE